MGEIRRNRVERTPTTGIVRKSPADAEGFFKTLALYGYAPTEYLVAVDRRASYSYKKERLGRFHHETKDWPQKDVPILRIETHRQYGYNTQSLYTHGPALQQYLEEFAIFDDQQLQWLKSTRIGGTHPSQHNIDLCCAVMDIQISAERANVDFINHLDAIKLSRFLSQKAHPLTFDVELPGTSTKLIPDAFFLLEQAGHTRMFFVEYDNGTEDWRKWQKKLLAYTKLAKTLPPFYVLIMYPADRKHGSIQRYIARLFPDGSDIFCLQPHPPRKPTTIIDKPSDYRFATDWQRIKRPPVNLGRL